MAFIKQEHKDALEPHEEHEWDMSFNLFGEGLFMVLAGFFVWVLMVVAIYEIDFPNLPVLTIIVRIVLCVGAVGLIPFLLQLERIKTIKFFEALQTPDWKDDVESGIVAAFIMLVFLFVDYKGGGVFLNYINKYDATVVKDHNTDKRISGNSDNRKTLVNEKEAKLNAMTCTECKIIESEYQINIEKQNRNIKSIKPTHTEGDIKYIKSQNKSVNSIISSLKKERDAKVENAKSRFEAKKDSVSDSYEGRVNRIDTAVMTLKHSIDSNNRKELEKADQAESDNKKYGGYLSPFLLAGLIYFRYRLIKSCKKAGMAWAMIGTFMRNKDFLSVITTPVTIFFTELKEKLKIDNSIRYAAVFDNIEKYTDEKAKSERQRVFALSGVSSMGQARMVHRQISQPVTGQNNSQNQQILLGNNDEKAILLEYISDSELALMSLDTVIDANEIIILNEIIEDCNLAILSL